MISPYISLQYSNAYRLTLAFKLQSCSQNFIFIVPLSACIILANIDNRPTYSVIVKFKYYTSDPTSGVSGGGVIFDTVALIYRHRAVMAHSEKLLDS